MILIFDIFRGKSVLILNNWSSIKHDYVKCNQKSKKQTETEKQIKGLGCFWPQGWVPANLANVVWMQTKVCWPPHHQRSHSMPAPSLFILYIQTQIRIQIQIQIQTQLQLQLQKMNATQSLLTTPPSKEPLYVCSLQIYIFTNTNANTNTNTNTNTSINMKRKKNYAN